MRKYTIGLKTFVKELDSITNRVEEFISKEYGEENIADYVVVEAKVYTTRILLNILVFSKNDEENKLSLIISQTSDIILKSNW